MISIVSMNVWHIGLATPKFVGFGWFDYQPNFNDKKVFLFLTIPENKLPGFETDYEMNNGTARYVQLPDINQNENKHNFY